MRPFAHGSAEVPGRARPGLRSLWLPALLLVALLLVACEKPDASDVTSPSAKALLGTTTGNVAYNVSDAPPAEVPPPDGWEIDRGNVRFSTLENGTPSIQVVQTVKTERGPGYELWFAEIGGQGSVLRWSGGSAGKYDGVVCFQLVLEDETSALQLDPEKQYSLTIAFRDSGTGDIVTSATTTITGRVPSPEQPAPGTDSLVGRNLLGCPRSVI